MGSLMRRALLAALAALSLAAPALAGTGTWPTTISTYTFRQGTDPTSGYSGCSDTYIAAAPSYTAKNFGGDSILVVAPIAYTGAKGEQAILVKFLFLQSDGITGGLPANFVCVRARLGLYKTVATTTGAVGTIASSYTLYLYRCLVPWTEGSGSGTAGSLSFANYDSATATAAWPGALYDAQDRSAWFYKPGVYGDENDSSTVVTSFFGTDSLYRSWANGFGAIPAQPTALGYLKEYSAPAGNAGKRLGWHFFDVTHDIQHMLIGANMNNGWIVTNSEATINTTATFAAKTYVGPKPLADKKRRPVLIIEGFVPSSSGTTGRRRAGF